MLLEPVRSIAREAGALILGFYGKVGATAKSDNSPLTAADLASHHCIVHGLAALTPRIPVLSEESEALEPGARRGWEAFWLVDPLDGTKEFLKQSGEFTVNIALIEGGFPILGVVYAPAVDLWYWAGAGQPACKQRGAGPVERISVRTAERERLTIVASRDHAGPLVAELLARFPHARTSSQGSSLKFCQVAEGAADIYLRDVPTMEWDTAAAQCVVEAAGGSVADLEGRRLSYNKPDLRNPSLVTLGDRHLAWR